MKNFTFIFLCLLLLPSMHAIAQAGTLDSTFNGNGKVITQINGAKKNTFLIGCAKGVAIQTDGKIVVGGQGSLGGGPGANFMAVRYKPDGKQDSSFGKNGQVNTPQFGTREAFENINCNGVVLPTDGKIILFGDVPGSYYNSFTMVRYTSAGAVDGILGTEFYSSDDDDEHSKAVAIQADGKIIQAGDLGNYSPNPDQSKFALTRYLPDGTGDNSFGNGSQVITKVGTGTENSGNALAIQADGKILLAGTVYDSVDFSGDFALLRYNADGTTDSSFGTNGVVVTDVGGNDEGNAVLLQAHNKIVVVGTTGSSARDFLLVRYNSDGKIDSTFGTNGVVITDVGGGGGTPAALQADGKIIVAGTSYSSGTAKFILVRYKVNGALDVSFGTGGIATVDFDAGATAYGMAIQPDGAIVVVGQRGTNFAVARLKGDSTGLLPVNIINFKAYPQGSGVKLSWTSLNEINVADYTIMRSANGKDFTGIGKMKARNNGLPSNGYSFMDALPLGGDNFYYLNAADRDGKTMQTGIVLVKIEKSAFIAYPNPVKDVVHIDGLGTANTTSVSLVDVAGRVLRQAVTPGPACSFNVKNLPAGLYYIRINVNNNITTLRFVKQ